MVDFLDFQRTYILKEIIDKTGQIKSYVTLYNQNIQLSDIEISGDTHYEHSANQRLYFMPGCTVPRIKVRDYCSKNGGAIVKDGANATVLFYSDTTVNELFECPKGFHKLSRSHYLKWLRQAYQAMVPETGRSKYAEIYMEEEKKVLSTQSPFVIIDDRLWALGHVKGQSTLAYLGNKAVSAGIPEEHFAESTGVAVREDMEDKAPLINSHLLCAQSAIVKLLNTMEIDKSMYNELGRMLASEDEQNTILAMEIMANCNYDKSVVYLVALMKHHCKNIFACKTKDHVNFRTLISYLGGERYWPNMQLDQLAEIIKSKGQNTPANRMLLVELMAPTLFEDEGATPESEQGDKPYEDFPEDDGVDIKDEW